jgi:hypothetical protein
MRLALLSSAAIAVTIALPATGLAADPIGTREARVAAVRQAVRELDKTARSSIKSCRRVSRTRTDCTVRINAQAPYTSCTARVVIRRTPAGRIRASIPEIACAV